MKLSPRNKKLLLYAGLNILVLSVAIAYMYHLNSRYDIGASQLRTRTGKTLVQRPLNRVPVQFTPELKTKLEIISDCRPQFLDWSEGSFAQFLDALVDAAQRKDNCFLNGDESKAFRSLAAAIARCPLEDVVRQYKLDENYRHECLGRAANYRQMIVDKVTQGEELGSLSAEILAQKLMAVNMSEKPKTEKEDELIAIGDALTRRDPDAPLGYKASAVGMIGKILDTNYAPTTAEIDRLEESIDILRDYPDQQREANQLEYAYLVGTRDFDRLDELVQRANQEQPYDGSADFFMSQYYNRNGQGTEGAIYYLNRALQKEPQNERYQRTLAALNSGQGEAYTFPLTIE